MPNNLNHFPALRETSSSSPLSSVFKDRQFGIDRLSTGRSGLREIKAPYSKGLGIVTKAFFEARDEVANPQKLAEAYREYTGRNIYVDAMTIRARNACFANLVREVCQSFGWLEGWICLAKVQASLCLHASLVDDVTKSKEVYVRLRLGTRLRPTINISLTVAQLSTNLTDSLGRLGPKGSGMHAWKASSEYAAVVKSWNVPGYFQKPCVTFGFAALRKTRIPVRDMNDCVALYVANIVAFDLDQYKSNGAGIQQVFDVAGGACIQVNASIHGPAIIAMMTFDFQTCVRQIQQAWTDQRCMIFSLGPEDVSPEDWISTQVGDYTSPIPFAYDSASEYELSRTTLFGTITLAACHNLIFDIGRSNRISNICYAEAAGVAEHGVHAAFAIGMLEEVVERIFRLEDGMLPLYGDCCLATGASWIPFTARYRLWERFVKYLRLLRQSKSPEAKSIYDMAHRDVVLKEIDLNRDCAELWARAIGPEAPSSLIPRQTETYFVPTIASKLLTTPGVSPPRLCASCTVAFENVIYGTEADEVHAAINLPPTVTSSRAAGLATGIRRAAYWAQGVGCCDICACRISHWADDVGYTVLVELMKDEAVMSAFDWLLECYFVGAVCFWPISVPTLLSCVDLVADVRFEEGSTDL